MTSCTIIVAPRRNVNTLKLGTRAMLSPGFPETHPWRVRRVCGMLLSCSSVFSAQDGGRLSSSYR
jgi:hypothetical protein